MELGLATSVLASFFPVFSFLSFFLRFDLFIFRDRGREGEREGKKYQCMVASHTPSTGDLAHNSDMCPDWEWNWRPFGSQPVLNPLSYTSQGLILFLNVNFFYLPCSICFGKVAPMGSFRSDKSIPLKEACREGRARPVSRTRCSQAGTSMVFFSSCALTSFC